MAVDLSVIVVNWNTKDLLQTCLTSLLGSDGRRKYHLPGGRALSLEVIVVDNASSDRSVEMVQARFPGVRLLVNEKNVGFTRANNQAMRLSEGRYVLLLNSDANTVEDALEVMVSHMDEHPQIGVVGPMLLNSDGSLQSSHRRFPTLATGFIESTILQRYFPRSKLLRRYYCEDLSPDSTHEVDWVVGAAVMVRRQAIEQVGFLDEGFFMYSEELDWCWRIKKAGWKVVYLPSARVFHHHGKSSEKDLPHRHIYFNDSKCKLYRKHFGLPAALLLRSFIFTTYLFQFLEEGLKFVVGHKRPLRRERIEVLIKVLRSGLRA